MSTRLNVTVCQLPDAKPIFDQQWEKLIKHIKANQSDLLLLPEFALSPWMAHTKEVDAATWELAIRKHKEGMDKITKIPTYIVLGTQPIIDGSEPRNEAFIWSEEIGLKPSHQKYYLPEEPGFWEATWYRRGPKEFKLETVNNINLGFLICSEMWFTEHARAYAKEGIHLLACPRATERSTVDRWLAGGRAAAIMSGAFCLSSNKAGRNNDVDWGGCGWIIDPSGNVLATTNEDEPFVTVEIDLEEAFKAKQTYPRYVKE